MLVCLKYDAHNLLCVLNNLENPEEGEMTAMFKKRVGQLNSDMSFDFFFALLVFCSKFTMQIINGKEAHTHTCSPQHVNLICTFLILLGIRFFSIHMFSVHRYDTPDNIAYHNNKW